MAMERVAADRIPEEEMEGVGAALNSTAKDIVGSETACASGENFST